MLRLAAGFVLAVAAACARPVTPPAAPLARGTPDLAVVTWNVHRGAGDVPRLMSALREGRLTGGRRPEAFVLLLQEMSLPRGPEALHTFLAPVTEGTAPPRGNAILSTLPLENARAIDLPRGRQRRVAAVATIEVQGVRLLLVNVHLENRATWWRGGLPGDRIRARQMEALLDMLPEVPGILAGDLNIWLGTRERAYQAAIERFPDVRSLTPPTFRERLPLDHLFFRLPAGWRAETSRIPSRYGSDHYPVLGVVTASSAVDPTH